jgi:hypothetical protein
VREAIHLTLSAPAWLVPAAFTTAGWVVVTLAEGTHGDNPWMSRDSGPALALMVITAVGLAGHVGMVRGWLAGRPPGSADFWLGIREHTWTLLLGKLACAGAVALLYYVVLPQRGPARILDVLYLVPSIVLGGLLGTAAKNPARAMRSLGAAFALGTNATGKIAGVVLAQMVWLGACWSLLFGTSGWGLSDVAPLFSILSYGQGPGVVLQPPWPLLLLWLAASSVGSSVCVTAMVLGVARGFAPQPEAGAGAAAWRG